MSLFDNLDDTPDCCPTCKRPFVAGGPFARQADPINSKAAGSDIAKREGSFHVVKRGSQKHLLLAVIAASGEPLTDAEAAEQAGLPRRSCGWHRVSDLLRGEFLAKADDVVDDVTGKVVRRTMTTPKGLNKLDHLD